MKDRIKLTDRDLRLLGIFRVLAEAGGLTAAETVLGMERSTISRHLQALEGRVGGILCSRGPKGFELTALGHKVFRAALAARDATLRAEAELSQSITGLTGKLFLGVADNTITNAECCLSEVIGQFYAMAPEVETHLSIRPPPEIVEEVLARRLDFAVLAAPPARFKLASEPLFDEEFRLYVRQPHQGGLSLHDLAARGLGVAMREGHWQSEALAEALSLTHRSFGRGLEAAAILIASGGYVGFLPAHLTESLWLRYPLVEVAGAEHLRYIKTFSLVYDPSRPFSPAGAAFAQVAQTLHADHLRDRGIRPATARPDQTGVEGMR